MAKAPEQASKPIKEFPPKQFGSSGEAVFDRRVQIRDESTGRLVKKQHYANHKFGNISLLERPVGSGNMFDEHGNPVGRWKHTEEGKWAKFEEAHVEVAQFEEVRSVEELAGRNAQLEAELAALKAEKEVTKPKEAAKPKA